MLPKVEARRSRLADMKENGSAASAGSKGNDPKPEKAQSRKQSHKRHWFRALVITLVVIVVTLAVGRAIMPWAVRGYVNRTLDRNPLYSGEIGQVDIHLWRGAYAIRDVRINKTTGNVPVPFFSAKRVDFAVQWNALWHHRVVGRVLMEQPELNFVDAPDDSQTQTGEGGPWMKMIQDLFPFKLNSAVIKDGSVHFRAYQTPRPVDVYLSQVNASIDNLGNLRNETAPLVSKVQVKALAMDQADLDLKITLDPFSYHPTFHLVLRLLGLDVTKINDLALAYGKFDFKRGWFDLVVEADSKEGQLSGYVKPLFRDLKIFSLQEDIKDNPLQFFWQALIGGVTTLFKNQPRNQLGTLIPFHGDVSGKTTTDILATLGNLLRNAFVRAYLPSLQPGSQATSDGDLHFDPPDITSPTSPDESP
jgi:hypothetical protein